MKNTLFAFALFAVVGTAAAQAGKPGKKDKKVTSKAVCVRADACCAKKSTTTAQIKALPAVPAPAN